MEKQAKFSLIINADDFGWNSQRDKGIKECFEKRGITDSTLIVNAYDSRACLEYSNAANLPVGLHLNLTDGPPMSRSADPRENSLLSK